jgi:hypothetical protein
VAAAIETDAEPAVEAFDEDLAQPVAAAARPASCSPIQIFILILLYAVPALFCVRAAAVADPDIWWHLRTGEWILTHAGVPHADLFSSTAAGQPWQAYSWLFDLLVYKLFSHFGLTGILAYSAGLVLAITAALHRLARRLTPNFALAVILTFAAGLALAHLFTPRPWLFTILFFVVELDLLMHARRTGERGGLLWLPLLFALWANLHIQFVEGLALLVLALGESLFDDGEARAPAKLSRGFLAGLLAACLVATCANPYGWNLYKVAYDLNAQTGVLDKISELQAIPFRSPVDFIVLGLALAAAAALARAPRFRLFETMLLLFAAYVSFKSQRDVWVMAATATALLAQGLGGGGRTAARAYGVAPALAGAGALIAIAASFHFNPVDNATLAANLAKAMPVRAVEDVQRHGYQGPLYNDFTWGGYLIWSLRQPVSLDGRAALHGDQRIDRSVATIGGAPDWASDPLLARSGIVLLPVKAPLAQLLRLDRRFKLVFADDVADVFIAARH